MNAISLILEDTGMQTYINENEAQIVEGTNLMMEFMDVIHEEVTSNPEKFIVPGDVAATHQNIKVFTEAAVASFADQLTNEMVAASA